MNKSVVVVVVLVVLAIGGTVAALQLRNDSSETSISDMSDEDSHSSSNSMDMGEQDLTAQEEVTMDIKDFDFEKPNIKIKTGTKVTWINVDGARHNIIIDGEGADGLGSKLLAKGESYSFTFNEPGLTNYLCEPHPYMKGIINVVE